MAILLCYEATRKQYQEVEVYIAWKKNNPQNFSCGVNFYLKRQRENHQNCEVQVFAQFSESLDPAWFAFILLLPHCYRHPSLTAAPLVLGAPH